MPARPAVAAASALLVLAGIAGAAAPAQAQQGYLYGERNFGHACRPPLKYAAGACVRRCPAGYKTMGGYCKLRSGNQFGF